MGMQLKFRRHDLHQFILYRIRRFARRQPAPIRDTKNMRIHGHGRLPEGHIQNDIRRFAPHAGQTHQIFPRIRHLAAIIPHKDVRHRNHIFGLGIIKANGLDILLKIIKAKIDHSLRRIDSFKKPTCGLIHADIGCLRRERHRHQ